MIKRFLQYSALPLWTIVCLAIGTYSGYQLGYIAGLDWCEKVIVETFEEILEEDDTQQDIKSDCKDCA